MRFDSSGRSWASGENCCIRPRARTKLWTAPTGVWRLPADRIRADAADRDFHGLNRPATVESQLVDAHHAMVAIRFSERPAMVDDVPLPRRRRLKDRVVPGARRDGGVLLKDLTHALERPEWR